MKICLSLILSASFAFQGCKTPACGEQILLSVDNPDSSVYSRKAEVVRVNCGATTPFETEVRLVNSDRKSEIIFAIAHETPVITLAWRDKDDLQVTCDTCTKKNITLKTVRKNFTNILYSF